MVPCTQLSELPTLILNFNIATETIVGTKRLCPLNISCLKTLALNILNDGSPDTIANDVEVPGQFVMQSRAF